MNRHRAAYETAKVAVPSLRNKELGETSGIRTRIPGLRARDPVPLDDGLDGGRGGNRTLPPLWVQARRSFGTAEVNSVAPHWRDRERSRGR